MVKNDYVDLISHFDFLAMISLFGLSLLLFILRLSSGTEIGKETDFTGS